MILDRVGGQPEGLTGNRKFLITKEGVIHFGTEKEYIHEDIIKRLRLQTGNSKLNEKDFAGGGNADCEKRVIRGWSKVCGRYDKRQVEEALERQGLHGWVVEESGN